MEEFEDQCKLLVEEAEEGHRWCKQASEMTQLTFPRPKNKKWLALMIIYTLFVLLGQSVATLLERFYYTKGGNIVLLEALLETIGFPILIPFSLYFSSRHPVHNDRLKNEEPSVLIKASVYVILGLFQSVSNVLYAIGLKNLAVSTFSLTSTTQLAFNAFFSFFLNAQKITLLILNSLILLSISSALLILHSNSKHSTGNSERDDFITGFSCTLIASALYSLTLSLTQLSFHKILKRETFAIVLDMIIYQSLVETIGVLMALFVSGEWLDLRKEMDSFELGRGSYFVVVVLTAVAWQVCEIGAVGLIFEASSLFSNVIGTVGLPVMPILAAIFFKEKMDGLKIVSIFFAAGGLASYTYQHYLDDCEMGKGTVQLTAK